jgi:hypothetical protein
MESRPVPLSVGVCMVLVNSYLVLYLFGIMLTRIPDGGTCCRVLLGVLSFVALHGVMRSMVHQR